MKASEDSLPFHNTIRKPLFSGVIRWKVRQGMKESKRKNRKRSLEDLNVIDDFLMNAAASEPEGGAEFCRLLLSTLLERKIGKVQVNVQKMIPAYTPGLRGIRMDVEVVEEMGPVLHVYDIEPCMYETKTENLAKHNRFYQGRIDGRYLQSGEWDFSKLPNLYVIMILPYDPFGKDYMMYQIQNRCREVPELDYPDGLMYIYFNTRGTKGGSPEIRKMLDYLQKSTAENVTGETLQKIHQHVVKVKEQPEVREEYMLLEEKMYYERKAAAREADLKRRKEDILELLEDYGKIPEELRELIEAEGEPEVLTRWLKLAARCGSLSAFEKRMWEGNE